MLFRHEQEQRKFADRASATVKRVCLHAMQVGVAV